MIINHSIHDLFHFYASSAHSIHSHILPITRKTPTKGRRKTHTKAVPSERTSGQAEAPRLCPAALPVLKLSPTEVAAVNKEVPAAASTPRAAAFLGGKWFGFVGILADLGLFRGFCGCGFCMR